MKKPARAGNFISEILARDPTLISTPPAQKAVDLLTMAMKFVQHYQTGTTIEEKNRPNYDALARTWLADVEPIIKHWRGTWSLPDLRRDLGLESKGRGKTGRPLSAEKQGRQRLIAACILLAMHKKEMDPRAVAMQVVEDLGLDTNKNDVDEAVEIYKKSFTVVVGQQSLTLESLPDRPGKPHRKNK